jgi:stage II sporulation protein D
MIWLAAFVSLQAAVEQAMSGSGGAAVVVDVTSEQILASSSRQKVESVLTTPGSTIKPFVLATLVKHGKLRSGSRLPCARDVTIRGRSFRCSHPHLVHPVDPVMALAYSCNSWFGAMAQRLEPEVLEAALRRWGFTVPAGSGEWIALGEGNVRVSPLALAIAYARLARSKPDPAILEGLAGAVQYGTAQLAATGIPAAGKTGTSTYAWFAGLVPADRPEIALAVIVPGGTGGAAAAPLAARIISAWGARQGLTVKLRDGRWQRMDREDYVTAALAGEMAMAGLEALKAMAVAVRTYATANLNRHSAEGFSLCDSSHCQNLSFRGPMSALRAAAAATEGELLWHQGAVAQVFHHRHCGGMTEAAQNLWPSLAAPYLRTQPDSFCLSEGRANWQAKVPAKQLDIIRRSPAGRVSALRVDGKLVNFEQFQRWAGIGVKSAWFTSIRQPDGFLLQGYGAGHGVGLCQAGARQRAQAGHHHRQILDFYFSGLKPAVTPSGLSWTRLGGERLELWTTLPARDNAVLQSAEQALRRAEELIGWTLRDRAAVRIYPTVAAFRDATGEPGWVAASTRNGVVRLQPGTTPALLHEMLHLLVEERAHPSLPLWFREGIVLWVEQPGVSRPASQLIEVNLSQPPSRQAMSRAYAAARARLASLVQRFGRAIVLSWVERGLPPELASHPTREP